MDFFLLCHRPSNWSILINFQPIHFCLASQGHNSPREFIVTQGPLHSTRDDFWRMCWESNSRSIIMLTRCFEKGREKCDQYWPTDTDPLYYGDINVQMLNSTQFSDWITTEFMVCRGNEQRIIRHFHFVTWPDFGGLFKLFFLNIFPWWINANLIFCVFPEQLQCQIHHKH